MSSSQAQKLVLITGLSGLMGGQLRYRLPFMAHLLTGGLLASSRVRRPLFPNAPAHQIR